MPVVSARISGVAVPDHAGGLCGDGVGVAAGNGAQDVHEWPRPADPPAWARKSPPIRDKVRLECPGVRRANALETAVGERLFWVMRFADNPSLRVARHAP